MFTKSILTISIAAIISTLFLYTSSAIAKEIPANVQCAEEEKLINELFDKKNFCSNDEDCVVAKGICPFECNPYVNRKFVDEINIKLDEYSRKCSKCIYECMGTQGAVCRNNKCIEKAFINKN